MQEPDRADRLRDADYMAPPPRAGEVAVAPVYREQAERRNDKGRIAASRVDAILPTTCAKTRLFRQAFA